MHNTVKNLLDIENNIKVQINKFNITNHPKIIAVSKTFNHGAIAKAVNEALTFISQESSSIDVIFLKSESLDIKKIRQVGVSFNFQKDRKEQITLSDTVITPRQNLKPPRLR